METSGDKRKRCIDPGVSSFRFELSKPVIRTIRIPFLSKGLLFSPFPETNASYIVLYNTYFV